MDQFQLSVDEVLYSDLTDAQLLAIVRLKALTAQLEQSPTPKQIARFVSSKTIKNITNFDPTLIELETNSTLTQVERVVKKRGYSKTKMRQVREKQSDVTGNLPDCYTDINKIKENKTKESKKDTNVSKKETNVSVIDRINFDDYMNFWNHYADLYRLAKVKMITEGRKKKIRSRLKKDTDFTANFANAVKMIEQSDFLKGSKDWKVTFDWLIENDQNYMRVLEGAYNGSTLTNQQQRNVAISERMQELYHKAGYQ